MMMVMMVERYCTLCTVSDNTVQITVPPFVMTLSQLRVATRPDTHFILVCASLFALHLCRRRPMFARAVCAACAITIFLVFIRPRCLHRLQDDSNAFLHPQLHKGRSQNLTNKRRWIAARKILQYPIREGLKELSKELYPAASKKRQKKRFSLADAPVGGQC